MNQNKFNQPDILEIASLRFKAIVAEAGGDQQVTLVLPIEAGVQGFVILLQRALPCIN